MNAVPLESQPIPHAWTIGDTVSRFQTDPHAGLTSTEAHDRLAHYGHNQLPRASGPPLWMRFLRQFQNAQSYLLLAAVIVSLLVWMLEHESGVPYEALAILAILLLNAFFGFFQEERADKALAGLRRMTPAEASVIRDGNLMRIEARLLVPGDLLALHEGDRISADARLLEVANFQTQESTLTGESLPVSKRTDPVPENASPADRLNMVYTGTNVVSGHARAVITSTGSRTEFGRISSLLQQTTEIETPLQKELNRLGKMLGIAVVIIAAVIIGTLLLVHGVGNGSALLRILLFGVALAVAATPEGLAAVVTIVLALGVERMARRGAIIRHLAAVETLGEATVIASDKTGTLTMNEMTVRQVVTASGRAISSASGYTPVADWTRADGEDLEPQLRHEVMETLLAAALANNASLQQREGVWKVHGDPTEGALLAAAATMGIDSSEFDLHYPRIGELPFTSERKRMSTLHSCSGRRIASLEDGVAMMTKGAADLILARCSHELFQDGIRILTDERRQEIMCAHDEMAAQSLRILGIAARALPQGNLPTAEMEDSLERNLAFFGLVGMIDPPRPEAKTAVAKAKAAGIRPILITGDHANTALSIARDLGIGEDSGVITGADLATMSDEDLASTLRTVSVFARVDPEHKLRIVRALQHNGEIVAMTGDGVNDAPALKAADIGVAMGITGTDVAKEAADLVLMDDNFATIVAAVEEGRAIFDNIRKFMRYLLATNFGEIMTLFFGVFLAALFEKQLGKELALPLLAVQVLWINLVTDGVPALALGLDPPASDIMARKPVPSGARVIDLSMIVDIFIVAVVMAAGTLGMFFGHDGKATLELLQTMAFTTLTIFQLVNTLNARSSEQSAFGGIFLNRWLWMAILGSLTLQFLVLNIPILAHALSVVPLTTAQWLRSILVASSVLWVMESVKWFRRRPAST
ncbi:MAG: cation-translocating P-type ATPase [Acidobacteriota bacterium]|nr:cation-translocating P-type ATPase [Acidobacteriota bacterium]